MTMRFFQLPNWCLHYCKMVVFTAQVGLMQRSRTASEILDINTALLTVESPSICSSCRCHNEDWKLLFFFFVSILGFCYVQCLRWPLHNIFFKISQHPLVEKTSNVILDNVISCIVSLNFNEIFLSYNSTNFWHSIQLKFFLNHAQYKCTTLFHIVHEM